MAAMWTYPGRDGPSPTYIADHLGAASVAHIYGQNIAAAESMTAFGYPWAFSPRDLQPVADLQFALGINRRRVGHGERHAVSLVAAGWQQSPHDAARLKRIQGFARAGVAVSGVRPQSSPSLSDDQTEFRRIART